MELSQTQKERIMTDCYADPALFCKTFLHDHFYREMPWVHRGILAILTGKADFLLKYANLSKVMRNFIHKYDETNSRQVFHVFVNSKETSADEVAKLEATTADGTLGVIEDVQIEVKLDLGVFTLILMPRGASKTTLAGLAVPLYKLLYQEDKFTLYVSKADRHSQGQLESVRKELVQNEVILAVFGDLKPKRSEEERWSKEKFETVTGIAMQARGKGSAIRGVNHNNWRPSTIIVDDPQSKFDCKSDVVREDDKKWAFAELTPARARIVGSRGKIIALGTWLHKHCLVAVWSRDPRWTTVKLEVTDLDGDWIWPDYMDEKEYKEEKASFVRAGLLGDFYREYHNQETIDEEVIFRQEHFIYEPAPLPEEMVCATFMDPATSKKRTADFCAIVTIGIHRENGKVWVLEAWIERGRPDEEKIEEFFRQSQAWKSPLNGVESNAGQAAFGSLLRAEMFRRHYYFELTLVAHKTKKTDRVRGALRPRYAAGYMRHRSIFPELEMQLLDFRADDSHDHDDGPDAEAAALVLADPAAAFFAEDDPSADQYDEIDPGSDDEYGEDYIWAS